MSLKKLLMVTTAYPYGQGEAFVKTELEHISEYFDQVEVVPSFYTAGSAPRYMKQDVNLDYVTKRWGIFRKFYMMTSFALALSRYRWWDDALRISTCPHKFENIKELARSLYRARLFERFLELHFEKSGKKFDVIYFYWMVPEIMGAIEFRKATGVPIKIVSRAHGGDLYEHCKAGGYAGMRDSIVTGVDGIYCISDHGKSYLESGYPWMAEKFHTARLGVDDPGYLNVQPNEGHLSIVSCSFMVPGKRLHLIVEALEYLLDGDPRLSIKWTHIGDGALYEQLQSRVIEKLDGRAQVVFTGYLTQDQLMDLYRDSGFDVVVNVSDNEGIPVSLMEASSAGIPMIATDVGGNSEIVNAENGILIAADADIATIAAALIKFKDRASASAYRRMARSCWNEKFNAHVNYSVFGHLLAEIAERAASAV